ncbi:hypothetical protein ACH5RR_001250 [Cinchona calisaya]|uniref:Uncharacterized protein n=1 Tax=Cinchona calisaya TaxID=153742 RepID=A0ABD3B2Z1_9GENT
MYQILRFNLCKPSYHQSSRQLAVGIFHQLQQFSYVGQYLVVSKPLKPVPFQLMHPPASKIKLNTDGSCNGNPSLSSSRGIIRDSLVSMVVAFSKHYGLATSLTAEVLALID